jgi:hypothetical protein
MSRCLSCVTAKSFGCQNFTMCRIHAAQRVLGPLTKKTRHEGRGERCCIAHLNCSVEARASCLYHPCRHRMLRCAGSFVEDDVMIGESLEEGLRAEDYSVT